MRERVAENRSVEFVVLADRADEKSELTYRRVREVLESWNGRSSEAGWRPPCPRSKPTSSLARQNQSGQSRHAQRDGSEHLGARVSLLIGAHVADRRVLSRRRSLRGEKERGTIETLLICPATGRDRPRQVLHGDVGEHGLGDPQLGQHGTDRRGVGSTNRRRRGSTARSSALFNRRACSPRFG